MTAPRFILTNHCLRWKALRCLAAFFGLSTTPARDNKQLITMISRERRDRIKSVLIRVPALFRAVRGSYLTYTALRREFFALIHFAPQLIAKELGTGQNSNAWKRELPVQRPLRADAAAVTPTLNPQQIKAWCSARHLPFAEGRDAIYLPPESWRSTPLAPALPEYPADAGLKIVRHAGGTDTHYADPDVRRAVAQDVYPHRLQTLTLNFLHLQGIAPRLYDLLEISDGSGVIWTAYVVGHVAPTPLLPHDCESMVARLHALESGSPLNLVSEDGWSGADFQSPDCNGNLLRDAHSRRPVYVGVHNFILDGYEKYLRDLAVSVTETSHIGGRSRLLGGKAGSFLYQEIPGLDWPAKRSPRVRLQAWDPMLARAGISIEGKVVFDFGCNLGLMGAEYLRRGVRWMHGWDRAEMVEAARKVLLSIGCTRFSLTGGMLDRDSRLAAGLPAHLQPIGHEDAILSYLSVRDHFGWLPGLSALPWRYMLYEGHQDDHPIETYIADLNRLIPVRLLTTDRVSDGVGGSRDIALIERLVR